MNRASGKATLFWVAASIGWTLAVLILSLIAHPPRVVLPLLSWDKFQHASAYALLTLLCGQSWSRLWPRWTRVWWWAGGFALVFGICMEVLQGWMGNGRSADPLDVLADFVGILAVALLSLAWRRLVRPAR